MEPSIDVNVFKRFSKQLFRTFCGVAVVATFSFASPSSANAQGIPSFYNPTRIGDPGSFVPGEIIVALKSGVTEGQLKSALSANGTSLIRPLRLPGYYLVAVNTTNGKPATETATRLKTAALKANSTLKYADMNYYLAVCDTKPNDPKYSQQWGYPLINMPQAWDLAKGTNDVVFVSVDTGVDSTHPEFAGRVIGARDFTVTPNTNTAIDGHGHGTHTTGTATADTNNGVGVAGVTFGTNPIFAAKVLNDGGSGTYAGVSDGIMFVADNVKTDTNQVVMNISLGAYAGSDTPDLTEPVEAAVYYAATQRNCVVCMAAGNAYEYGNPSFIPARAASLDSRLICVAACGKQKEKSSFSEARPYTTISAPGGNGSDYILSTLPVNQGSYGGPGWEGTSMATPHIAGVSALLLGMGITADKVKDIVTASADDLGQPVPNPEYGYGVVDAYAALYLAIHGSLPPPGPPSGLRGRAGDSKVTLNWLNKRGATSVNIKRADTSGGPYTTIQTVPVSASNFVDTGLTNGSTYYYVVSSQNDGGEGKNSNEIGASPFPVRSGLLFNPGFENGLSYTPWIASPGVINNSKLRASHAGFWKAWLCGYGANHTDFLYQTVSIPVSISSATLSFYLHIDTADNPMVPKDRFYVQVRSSSGAVLATLGTFSNVDAKTGFQKQTFDMTAFAGKTVQVYLTGTETGTKQTSFVVDDFSLIVE